MGAAVVVDPSCAFVNSGSIVVDGILGVVDEKTFLVVMVGAIEVGLRISVVVLVATVVVGRIELVVP